MWVWYWSFETFKLYESRMLCVYSPVVLGSFAFIFQSFLIVHNFCIHFLFLLHQENSFRFVCFDLCLCMCVSVTYNPSCLFFPDTSVQLPWQSMSVWDGWIDGEREREGGKCLCNQTPPSFLPPNELISLSWSLHFHQLNSPITLYLYSLITLYF